MFVTTLRGNKGVLTGFHKACLLVIRKYFLCVCELRDRLLINFSFNATSMKSYIYLYIYTLLIPVKFHSLMPYLHTSYLPF